MIAIDWFLLILVSSIGGEIGAIIALAINNNAGVR